MVMKTGDKVVLIGIPPGLPKDEQLQTRELFQKCLGKSFIIAGMKMVEGLSFPLVQLDVGHVLGKAACLETIWVEPEYLKPDPSE